MLHIVVGLLLVILGWWGISENWYLFLDLVWVVVPMLLLLLGIVSLLAGLGSVGHKLRSAAPREDSSAIEGE
jgi:hypothetical protein